MENIPAAGRFVTNYCKFILPQACPCFNSRTEHFIFVFYFDISIENGVPSLRLFKTKLVLYQSHKIGAQKCQKLVKIARLAWFSSLFPKKHWKYSEQHQWSKTFLTFFAKETWKLHCLWNNFLGTYASNLSIMSKIITIWAQSPICQVVSCVLRKKLPKSTEDLWKWSDLVLNSMEHWHAYRSSFHFYFQKCVLIFVHKNILSYIFS